MTKYKRNDRLIKVLKKDKLNYFSEVNDSKVFEKYKNFLTNIRRNDRIIKVFSKKIKNIFKKKF